MLVLWILFSYLYACLSLSLLATRKKEIKEDHAGFHWKPKSTMDFFLWIFYWKSAHHQIAYAILFRNRTTAIEDPSADIQSCSNTACASMVLIARIQPTGSGCV